ncbi:MAG: aldose 1-epimerase family protein, partial [Actinomycetes bacterium]
YGIGQHPYFTVGTALVDDALLTVPAECWVRTDERGLPVATEPVAGTPYDFRSPRRVGDLRLDTPYAELARDGSGRSVVRLSRPAGGPGLDVWLGGGAHFLQVFSGDTLPDPARRRRGLAVEPMSCPPDAFRSGIGLVTLEPGGAHTLRWGVTPW